MERRKKLSLINHTVYDWIKTEQQNFQMAYWQFPDVIPASCTVDVEIEWKKQHKLLTTLNDGLAHYVLFGSRDRSFQIQAMSQDTFDIQIHFSNLPTKQFPIGSVIHLKWDKGGVRFKLSGTADEFYNESGRVEKATCG